MLLRALDHVSRVVVVHSSTSVLVVMSAVLVQRQSLIHVRVRVVVVVIDLAANQVNVLQLNHALHLHAWLVQGVSLVDLEAPVQFGLRALLLGN